MTLACPLPFLLYFSPEHLDWVFSIYLGIPLPQKYRLGWPTLSLFITGEKSLNILFPSLLTKFAYNALLFN